MSVGAKVRAANKDNNLIKQSCPKKIRWREKKVDFRAKSHKRMEIVFCSEKIPPFFKADSFDLKTIFTLQLLFLLANTAVLYSQCYLEPKVCHGRDWSGVPRVASLHNNLLIVLGHYYW